MLVVTAQNMYDAVLHELRKEHTTSMTPREFNYHSSTGHIEYVKTRYWAFDQHQKHIDDLQKIIVRTHGNGGMPAPIINTGGNTSGAECFELPYTAVGNDLSEVACDQDVNGKMFLLNVKFMFNPLPKNCLVPPSGWFPAQYRKHDTVSNKNYYYTEKAGCFYYQEYDNKIWRIEDNGSGVAEKALVTYLRFPIFPKVSEDTGLSVVNPELDARINIEIVKWITHSFLETIESYRLQTMANIQSGVFNQIQPTTIR